ncbi:MAG: hypothetical protein ABIH52_04470 [Candidatus Aenigmatarchaeota archaeon]
MSSATYLARNFDLVKGAKECNCLECSRMPTKEMVLLELDLTRNKHRELGTIYICSDHFSETSKKTLFDMNKLCKTGRIIDKKVFDIGYVTY